MPRLDARAATRSGMNRCDHLRLVAGFSALAFGATRFTLLHDRDPFRRCRALEQARYAADVLALFLRDLVRLSEGEGALALLPVKRSARG